MDAANALLNRLVADVINPALLVLFAAGLFMFMLGLFQYIRSMSGGDTKGIEDGWRHIRWGIVGMAMMVSVYGIISLITNTIGVNIHNPDTTVNLDIPSMRLTNP